MNKTEDHVEETAGHEGFIKTPKQLAVTVVLAFIVPIVVIILLIRLVVSGYQVGAGSDTLSSEAVATRIKPVAGFELVDADAPKVFQTGQQVYETTCVSCHGTGVAGAPIMGDKAAWAPLLAEGYDQLLHVAIHGEGAMPPKGGNSSLSDYEVERAVVYMANQSGASFDEPAEPSDDADGAAPEADVAEISQPAPTPAPDTTEEATTKASDATPAAAEEATTQTADQAPVADPAATDAQEEPAPEATQAAATIDPAGEKLYKSVCFSCHDTGVAAAPKIGNKAEWAPLIATGMDTMVEIAIHGKGAMPPRGGSQASDAEVRAAVEYMVQASQ